MIRSHNEEACEGIGLNTFSVTSVSSLIFLREIDKHTKQKTPNQNKCYVDSEIFVPREPALGEGALQRLLESW